MDERTDRRRVAIAIVSGTAIAREGADLVLVGSNLDDLVRTLHTAQRARRIVMINFAGRPSR